jgi:hypothetical protein
VARVVHVLNLSAPNTFPIGLRMFGFLSTVAFLVFIGALLALVGLQASCALLVKSILQLFE